MNVIMTGWKGNGKGTACAILAEEMGWNSMSSSYLACELFIFDALKDKYGYKTIQECYDDRGNHRQEWYEMIREFNKDDKTRLGRILFERYEIYDGIRDLEELQALQEAGLVDYVIWVDAYSRTGMREYIESMNVLPDHCNTMLDNNGDINYLTDQIMNLCPTLHGIENGKGVADLTSRVIKAVAKTTEDVFSLFKDFGKYLGITTFNGKPIILRQINGNTVFRIHGDNDGKRAGITFLDIPPVVPGSLVERDVRQNATPFLQFEFEDIRSIDAMIKAFSNLRKSMAVRLIPEWTIHVVYEDFDFRISNHEYYSLIDLYNVVEKATEQEALAFIKDSFVEKYHGDWTVDKFNQLMEHIFKRVLEMAEREDAAEASLTEEP